MPHLLERTSRLAIGLLFPARCALCSASGTMLCDPCIAALPATEGRRCQRCWTPSADHTLCEYCSSDPDITYASIRAPFVLEEGARTLVHKLKYAGVSSLGEPMGVLIAEKIEISGDLVVPIPLHRGRRRSRGYNQAELLSREIALSIGLPFDAAAARRIRATKPLAGNMNREERRAMVAGAFSAVRERVEGRRILLVDDVVTTGATLDSCSRALLDAGAASVRCVTFARAS